MRLLCLSHAFSLPAALVAVLVAALPGAIAADARLGSRRLGRGGGGGDGRNDGGGFAGGHRAPDPGAASSNADASPPMPSGNVLSIVKMRSPKQVGSPVSGGLDGLTPTNLRNKCQAAAAATDGTVEDVYDQLDTCALSTPPSRLLSLSALNAVENAVPNEPVAIPADEEVDARGGGTLRDPGGYAHGDRDRRRLAPTSLWGLDRVNQCVADGDGDATRVDAEGVRVYVLDTGVRGDHVDLAPHLGPEDCHYRHDLFSQEGGAYPPNDSNGHGTHVAGTACGDQWGVAGGCEICAVKVLGADGGGSFASLLGGLNFVKSQCTGASGHKCVINMSLGGGSPDPTSSFYQAFTQLMDAGVVMVVAAGNSNDDACGSMPSAHPDCLTVGATRESPPDSRAQFSSWGTCTEIYAPGKLIESAWNVGTSATNIISGTSMACPHVAGLAAHTMKQFADAGAWSATRESAQAIRDDLVGNALNTGVEQSSDPANDGAVIKVANAEGDCPTLSPTPAPTPCVGEPGGRVTITTDNYPDETTWTIVNVCNGDATVASGGPYEEKGGTYEEEVCLYSTSEYRFTISDSYGDGMCCNSGDGGFAVTQDGDEVVSGGDFGLTFAKTWGSCASPPPTPPPVTDAPDAPPALVVAQAATFAFTPQSSCFAGNASAATSHGTTPGQCAQACAVLLDCVGFEVFRGDAGVHREGDCVLTRAGVDQQDAPGCPVPVWYYARSEI